MFEHGLNLIIGRGFMAALCLACLAGCGEDDAATSVAATTPAAAAASAPAPAPTPAITPAPTPAPTGVAATPVAPTGLAATAGNAQVSLTWSASTGATSYAVKRSTSSGGPHVQIATATSPSYTDTTVSNASTYYYVVAAVNSQGASANSAQASATPTAGVTTPTVPVGLTVTAEHSKVTLNWSASSGATGYKIKRSITNGGPYTDSGSSASASYSDFSVTDGTTYFYVVSAINSKGESANSAQVSALPTPTVPAPTTFGTFINVTPLAVGISVNLNCGNYGTETIQADPAHPSNLYVQFHCQGIWKSTDYGATWTGPINTGTNGATVSDCAGGIAIPHGSTANVPTIYQSCIRGAGTGFWKSVDGGVNWTRYFVAPSGSGRQDYYPPVIDPYDSNHLLMAGHEMNYLVESVDGGQNWTEVTVANGMSQNGGTGAIFFINTGNAGTTRGNWMWMAQQSGGGVGTWRTTSSGANWVQVDRNEHPHGASQIYQPDNNGVVYMAGAYSDHGWGVLRSTNYGQTWTHVGNNSNQMVVVGTSKNIYSMFGYPVGIGGLIDPSLQVAAQPGSGTWAMPGTPVSLTQGAAQVAVVNNGTNNILVAAMWNSGVWRYIEP